MNIRAHRQPSPWSGLVLSQLLGFAFLVFCIWWVWREVALILPNDRITASLSVQKTLGPVLQQQLLEFGGALLLSHALFGFAAFALARLTEAAFEGSAPARRGWLVSGWFVLLVGLVMAANVLWHPSSRFVLAESWFLSEVMGLRIAVLLMAGSAALLLFLLVRAARRLRVVAPAPAFGIAGGIAAALLAGITLPFATAGMTKNGLVATSPHVVIIGIDSLRADVTGVGAASLTPNIDDYLAGAHRFTDTTTPLARTYGSWVSILTGRHPVATHARYNLMPRALVDDRVTLPDALKGRGYRTIYATDEVRFANIDQSFGFDQLVTPPIGAADFLLGYAGDMPLVNLLATTGIGGWLFPANHANRAAHATYEPGDFVDRLDDEIAIERPTFLTMHLTLSHWPYNWAGLARPTTPQQFRPAYRRAVLEVDRQFRQVMDLLADKGVLENAIVVVLSDHGEALGNESDSMLRKTGTSREVWDSLWGHGTSVMSPHQYSVLLAMRAYGRAALPGAPGTHDWPVSLEDVRPTLEEFATGQAPAGVDGISLLPYLAEPAQASRFATRVRFTETDFNTSSTLAGRYEASGIIDEAAVFYELDSDTGWMQLRQDKLPILLARKQRAALSSQSLLAAIPDPDGRYLRFLYTDRHDPAPRLLEARPDPGRDPDAARLWDALQARFPGELPTHSNLPRM
ncbi:MAG: sulfatase-like hydrolase/transferase [Steroidobacteraceae bacterium]